MDFRAKKRSLQRTMSDVIEAKIEPVGVVDCENVDKAVMESQFKDETSQERRSHRHLYVKKNL